jgi:hypothetical protein
MRFAARWIAAVALATGLFLEGTVVLGRTPVLPIPTPRQPSSILSPKAGVPKSPLMAPNTKGAKKRSWFPFGNRNKRA